MKFIELIRTVACNMHFVDSSSIENPRINLDAWLPN
jgi:hypothetical protein